jgi:hypothetical protein
LQAMIGIRQPIPYENANTNPTYRDERESVLGDNRLMQSLRDSLSHDLRFYERLRAKRP